MHKRIYILLFGFFFLIFGCQKENRVQPKFDDIISKYRTDNTIKLEVSSDSVQLNPAKKDQQALLLTWEPQKTIDSLFADSVKYFVTIDIAGNDFKSSTDLEEIKEGSYFKVYTNRELNDLLRNEWNVEGDNYTTLSFRVIAEIFSDKKYIKPLYSTKNVKVKPFNSGSLPLYLYGSAMHEGNESGGKIAMDERVEGTLYSWRGKLYPGKFKLATQFENDLPGYGKDGKGKIKPINNSGENGFEIEKEGYYAIVVNILYNMINIESVKFENLYFGGSATAVGWSAPLISMNWDANNPHIWTVHAVDITSGELKFSETQSFSQRNGDVQVRPRKPNASIINDLDVSIYVLPDWKWKVKSSEEGKYDIVLDLKAMSVQFNKR